MKSNDGGNTFITTGLSFNITNYYRGNRVLIDPVNTNVIIVSTSNGIYRSYDGGVSFSSFSSINMTDIEFHTTNSNIVYGHQRETHQFINQLIMVFHGLSQVLVYHQHLQL